MKLFAGFMVILLFTGVITAQIKMPPSVEETKNEPIVYTGEIQTDKKYYDGSLPHAVGVHHFQVLRSNRSYPSEPGVNGWTYNHQPYLAYWNNKFYLQYLSGEIQEHTPPTRILISTSEDGENWEDPIVAFPPYPLPEINYDGEHVPEGTMAVMHQRMGWYVAPNSKLLTLGFISYCPTPRRSPNAGTGLGRIVREVKNDGSFGPIYFIRYNRHAGWNETNTNYPFYTESENPEFIQACESLLADKLISLQWWEEDRGEDGFYKIDPSKVPGGDVFHRKITTAKGAGKAFNFYERPDGVIVGIWKNKFAALTTDRGETWTDIAVNSTLWTTGAKTWGQKTDDGRYAIVHNQSATQRNRFPMAVLVSEDGYEFDRLYCLRGEMPPRKYQGLHKNPGAQYFRGIIEGNGNPPGDFMWNTYSMNKEDIWVSRTALPIVASADSELNESFEQFEKASDLESWNLYFSKWAFPQIEIEKGNKYLGLTDEEPYDYATAERIFPSGTKKKISFRFRAPELPQGAACDIEVQDQRHKRALKLRIDKEWLSFDIESVSRDPVKIYPKDWNTVVLIIDCVAGTYRAEINNVIVAEDIALNDSPGNVERIVIRTGRFRGFVPPAAVETGIEKQSGFYSEDLIGADVKAPKIEIHIDDLITEAQ